MPRFKSIISRIVILHVVAVAVTSILMSLALSWLLNYATNNIHNQAMKKQAIALAEHLEIQPDGKLKLSLTPDLQGLYSQPYGRYSYAVIDSQNRVVFSSLKDRVPLFPRDAKSGDVEFLQRNRGDATVSGASVKRVVGGQTVWVQAGEDLDNRDVLTDDIVAEFFRSVGWIILPILFILLVIDIAIFRRALKPLRQASQIAETIGPLRADIRLPTKEIPREVRPLVLAVNQALDRLEEGFRVQRDFTADAAHELRTPLSILRTRMETLEDQQVGKALLNDIEGMTRIINQLLDIAELDSFVIDPHEEADLRMVCTEVLEFLAPLALAQGKEVALVGTANSVLVRGNAEMLNRAIRNLAENAIRHTSPGSTVEFVVEENGTVSVLDDGPGISDEERDFIFQRFWRRDRGMAGSTGLGLPIVQRIAELHTATITLTNRKPRGACFSIKFARLSA
ncbi:MAG: sensor histidine kinase N-terminal domain-containing protein [Rhizobiales bacterium]|nr:sensor histidine kinase N-terminal domain-containing protein [Hyphomicrobiales bacterium]